LKELDVPFNDEFVIGLMFVNPEDVVYDVPNIVEPDNIEDVPKEDEEFCIVLTPENALIIYYL
jgi:hypothetical protein